MEWKAMEQQWGQIKPHVRERWNKLTDDDVTQIAGNRDRLVAKLRERYSFSAQDAEKQVLEFKEAVTSGVLPR